MSEEKTIAVVGGTGNLGAALARRWAKAGLKVIIGSRTKEGADSAAATLGFGLSGMTNGDAAAARSEEHTSELQSLMRISYAVFCLKKKNKQNIKKTTTQYTRLHK